MYRLQALLLSAVLSLGLSCAAEPSDSTELSDTASENAAPSALVQARKQSYFLGRQDERRCRWPLCGGYWVRLLNHSTLRCLDGTVADECYVALLDTEALGGTPLPGFGAGRVIVRGAFAQGNAGEFGDYALLRVTAAWEAVADVTSGAVDDSGASCATTTCPSSDSE